MSAGPYPAAMMIEARRLHRAGWTTREIPALLAALDHAGRAPAQTTVWRWINERGMRRHLERERSYKRSRSAEDGRFTLRGTSPEYREAFMRRLQAERVPRTSIAKVCTVVFDEPYSRDRVATILGDGE
jgi:hypothetical protein